MKKRFEYKLDAALKIRRFREQNIKIELGKILKKKSMITLRLEELSSNISLGYQSQENILKEKTSSEIIKFFPRYIQGLREDITNNETLLKEVLNQYSLKMKELVKAMGDVKVIEKLKEKEYNKFKKKMDKLEQEELEELFNLSQKVRI